MSKLDKQSISGKHSLLHPWCYFLRNSTRQYSSCDGEETARSSEQKTAELGTAAEKDELENGQMKLRKKTQNNKTHHQPPKQTNKTPNPQAKLKNKTNQKPTSKNGHYFLEIPSSQ